MQPHDDAEAILHAAEHGGRDDDIGGGAEVMISVNKPLPAAMDQIVSTQIAPSMRRTDTPGRTRDGSLHDPGEDSRTRSMSPRWVRSILYARARIHPLVTAGLMTAVALAGAALISRRDN